MTQRSYVQYNTSLEEMDTIMNAHVQAIRIPDTPEKVLHHDFTMVPNILLDPNEHVIESHMLGFIRFLRKFGGHFVGSLGKLARGLKMVKTTVSRMIDAWKNGGLVTIEQAEEDMQIMACNIWAMNEERYPRNVTSAVAICNSSANNENSAVANRNSAVANRNSAVAQSSTNSGVILHTNTTEEESVIPNESVSEDISSPSGDDGDLPPYEDGYLEQSTHALLEWLEQELSTPVIPIVENDYHSHSQEPTPISNTPTPPPKRRRKPRAPTIDADMAVKVAKIFDGFDRLLQEVTGDTDACYAREKTAQAAIIDTLLPCKPTWERLHRVYLELWNRPRNAKDNFLWQEHMTIKAICNNYQTTWLGLQAKERPVNDTGLSPYVTDLDAEMARKQALYAPKGGTRGATSATIN